jgi:flagellar protein FliO/FliZ
VSTGAALGLRVTFALGLVLGLMWLSARVLRGRTGGRGGHALEVLARAPLGRNASVAVLRVGDQALVLGVTDQGIAQLGPRITDLTQFQKKEEILSAAKEAEGDSAPVDPWRGSILSPVTWRTAVEALRERTVRH